MKLGKPLAHVFALFVLVSPAVAWDGVVTGTIATFDVTNGGNLGFRVALTGAPTMCTGGPGWAYLNEADSNYKVYVAALIAAKAAGNKVTLYTDASGGYCRVGYISMGS